MGSIFSGAPKIPDMPSEKPTRDTDVQPEDIVLGTDNTDNKTKGKRALIKPSGSTNTSGLKV